MLPQPMVINFSNSRHFEKCLLDKIGPLITTICVDISENAQNLTIQDHLTKYSIGIP